MRARKEEEEWGRRAHLRVRLEKAPDQIVLWNEGGADATNVRLQVRSRGGAKDPIEGDARRKLPLPRLQPEDECTFSAFVFWDYGPVFEVEMRQRMTSMVPDAAERRSCTTHAPSFLPAPVLSPILMWQYHEAKKSPIIDIANLRRAYQCHHPKGRGGEDGHIRVPGSRLSRGGQTDPAGRSR